MSKPLVSIFGNLLVTKWLPQFSTTSTITFRSKTATALNAFSNFRQSYEKIVRDFYNQNFPTHDKDEAARKEFWITDQINLALDLFWEPLARAAEQLRSEPYREFYSNTSELTQVLKSYKANVHELFGDQVNNFISDILIYFDKTTKIMRFPYTDIALIGIPYRVLVEHENTPGSDKTWMPIAHELAHHIYWNMAGYTTLPMQMETFKQGILKKQETENGLPVKIKNLIKPWLEEIFADAIGLQISGKFKQDFLTSCKEMILRKTDDEKKNLSMDDGEHVPDGLRLLILFQSLGEYDPEKEWNDFLEKEVGERAGNIKLNLRDEFGHILPETVAVTEVAGQICNTAKIILDEVRKFKEDDRNGLFKLRSSRSDDPANELLQVAKKLGKGDPKATLYFLLNPEVLEGEQGGTTHTHYVTWEQANGHSHSRVSSATHTH